MKLIRPKTVEKPWGRELWLAEEDEYAGKILEIKKGTRTSLQYHEKKKETLYVLSGRLIVITSNGEQMVNEGQSITFNPGERHRLVAEGDIKLVEISTPELEDVVRLEDDYGRK